MDVTNSSTIGGSLQISTDVIAKIAKLATLEIEGVKEVSTGTMGVKSLFNKVNLQKPILVQLTDDVAEITVNIMVRYGYKIPQLCEKVQENVKSSVQNMTCITVSKVNIVVTGVRAGNCRPGSGVTEKIHDPPALCRRVCFCEEYHEEKNCP